MANEDGYNWSTTFKRVAKDIGKLLKSGYPVMREDGDTTLDIDPKTFCTTVHGPVGTPYMGGTWRVRFTFTHEYPFKNPSIGFVDRIYHPNIDWRSGSICLDAISKEWMSNTSVIAIVEMLLPGLLAAPNPNDPLNSDAALKMLKYPVQYDKDVRAAVQKHAYRYEAPAPAPVTTSASASASAAASAAAAESDDMDTSE